MLKKRKIILAFVCLFVIGGVLYGTNYSIKKHNQSVQTIKINQQNKTLSSAAKNKEIQEEATLSKVAKKKEEEDKIAKQSEAIKLKKASVIKAAAQKSKAKKEATAVKTEAIKASAVKTDEYKKSSNGASKKVVVIDPGHASISSSVKEPEAPGSSIMKVKEPGGAQGINSRTPEYVVNMAVAVKLRSLLQAKGYTVIMTKTQNSLMLGNIARAEVGNKAKADLVIRIHADSNNNTSAKGASMLVPSDTKNTNAIYNTSKSYGETVFKSLVSDVGMNNRGVMQRDDMTGFNWSKVPVILVEMGFLSNVSEDKLLNTNAYQAKIANGLADGIYNALK
ncbi:N-acetylmuramoyl-L-alanine amidase family protein [Clostridium psychrophilum]|uniref:N-acetylmuramoyl-L-alanine amidase family protein n=1 Tax=Clostridium psychrophilum TaxID=132926 RepID=UPI001C0C89AD|nr:N-acetylmuramoyl-L-alanine amidase [Clostridium psychrophilum]MBU3179703.1 N-acetylmuramoyl-L-alanine amidase [Clostridium psychrophilum]